MPIIASLITIFFEFLRNNCIAVCATLVPANLLLTTLTWGLFFTPSATGLINWGGSFGNMLALVLVSHVLSWWVIGVREPASFVLLILGSVCLVFNLSAMIFKEQVQSFVNSFLKIATSV